MADLSELLCMHVMTIIFCSIASHRTRLLENTSAVALLGRKERKDLRLYPNTSRKHGCRLICYCVRSHATWACICCEPALDVELHCHP